jgi:hypothetical protein
VGMNLRSHSLDKRQAQTNRYDERPAHIVPPSAYPPPGVGAGVTGVVPPAVEAVRLAARHPDLLAAATVRRLCFASSASSSLASSPAAAAAAKRPQPCPGGFI